MNRTKYQHNFSFYIQRVRTHLALDPHRTEDIGLYAFNHTSDVSTEELKKWGINSEIDVGSWLVHILKNRFKQDETAQSF